MASLRRVLRVAKAINQELQQASGASVSGSRGGGGARMAADMSAIRASQARIEKMVKGNPADLRRQL